ncbi:MAG: TIGR00269 family protein [Candidatus Micrarchaeota archaeon]|nr:TIGR00269 family protein [Candidatus Micrarchaeota archaeon]
MGSSKCTKCGKPAAITLRYANMDLCQSHFVKMFESRVKRTVRQFNMLKKGDVVAVGVSGGKDSCVMLHMLHKISQSLPFKLTAITIDEGITGYRNKSLEVAKKECKKLGIPLKIVSFDREFGKTLDALDAVAQTVLMKSLRNEPDRLARFAPVSSDAEEGTFIPRIKPLFMTPERDVAAYAVMKGIEIKFMECPYARFAFRQYVRDMLNSAEQKYPGTKLRIVKAFLSQSEILADGMRLRQKGSKAKHLNKCATCGEPTSQEHCNLCLLLEKN